MDKIVESEEIRSMHQKLYDAICSGNAESVEALYSKDPMSIVIGTDPEEVWTDPAKHHEDTKDYWQKGNKIDSKEIMARQRGDIGWSTDEFTHSIVTGEVFHARVSIVWIKEDDGKWRIIYSHSADLGTK